MSLKSTPINKKRSNLSAKSTTTYGGFATPPRPINRYKNRFHGRGVISSIRSYTQSRLTTANGL